jgi:hypothetical protein
MRLKMNVEIPKGTEHHNRPNEPAWFSTADSNGNALKPIIRCNCGMFMGIRLHHVHADGTVTASFFHAKKADHPQGDDSGCGWHVFLKLKDWTGQDFPPGK